jgi:hypothetical protein
MLLGLCNKGTSGVLSGSWAEISPRASVGFKFPEKNCSPQIALNTNNF